jgi:hypothetical protein
VPGLIKGLAPFSRILPLDVVISITHSAGAPGRRGEMDFAGRSPDSPRTGAEAHRGNDDPKRLGRPHP